MRILFDIGHPKDVNVFRNVIKLLEKKGHDIKIVARAKENAEQLLNEYGLDYDVCRYYNHISGKIIGILAIDIILYRIARKFKPDAFVSPASPYSAHVSRLLRKPHLAFPDTEIANFVIKLMLPFTDEIYTSSSFYLDLGKKHKRFDSYFELAYLHPKYFKPDKEVIKKYELNDDYIILRLSALASHHDIGASGFSFRNENELKSYIEKLEEYGRVILISETNKWPLIKKYQLKIDPKDFHQLLFFAKMYIGEGATMASESAILGVPSIYVSSTRRGYLDELEAKYGLVFSISDKNKAFEKATELLKNNNIKNIWALKREKMIDEKLDPVDFMVNCIENVKRR